jgi:ribonuclease T2
VRSSLLKYFHTVMFPEGSMTILKAQLKSSCRFVIVAVLVCFLAASFATAKSKKKPHTAPTFSYYLLTLSYAPDFCAQKSGDKDPRECGAGRRVGFVVHGLWPQGEAGRGPENCGSASPVSKDIIAATLRYIPTESLIQHEWSTHGTCSGLSQSEYFALVRKARDSVSLPDSLNQPSGQLQLTPEDIEGQLAKANPTFPKDSFRLSCYPTKELQEVRVCLNKDLSPGACTASAGECIAAQITLRSVR